MAIYNGVIYWLDVSADRQTVYVIDSGTGEIVAEVNEITTSIALAKARELVEEKGGIVDDHSNIDRR